MNIKEWIAELHNLRKPLPLLSFPSKNLIGASVYDITHSAELQVKGMLELSERYDMPAIIGMMDLSLEAEAFGAKVKNSINEVPVIVGSLVTDEDEANELEVPDVYSCRTAIYVEAAKTAKENGEIKEMVYSASGLYANSIKEIIKHLEAASEYAENDTQNNNTLLFVFHSQVNFLICLTNPITLITVLI